MTRWLTTQEMALELGVHRSYLSTLVKRGLLVSLGERPNTRYLDPAPELIARIHEKHLDYLPLVTSREIAEVCGQKHGTIRQLIWLWKYPSKARGRANSNLYDRRTVRQIVNHYERIRGRKSRPQGYSPLIVEWLRKWLKEQEESPDILQQLIEQAVKIPDPKRVELIAKLWSHFDAVNKLLEECNGIAGRSGR